MIWRYYDSYFLGTPLGGITSCMSNRKVIPAIALALFVSFLIDSARTQTKRAKYPLTQFDNEGCMAKGRVQDCSGTVMQKILADGQNGIPVLIS